MSVKSPESATTPPPATGPESNGTVEPPAPNGGPGGDDFKSPESKQAVLADLKKEREARQALADELSQIKASQDQTTKALAEAFGLTGEPKTEDLAETVKNLQQQMAASQLEATRLRIAAEHNIPAEYQDLLTETEMEKLSAQAEKVGALVAAQAAAGQAPPFVNNPGQGQGQGGSAPSGVAELDQKIEEAIKANDMIASIGLKQQRAALISKSK